MGYNERLDLLLGSDKKYEIIKLCMPDGSYYNRIRALKTFNTLDNEVVNEGDLGGFIDSEKNLSQDGDCWIDSDSQVKGSAKVINNALIKKSKILDNSSIEDNVIITNSTINGNVVIDSEVRVTDSNVSGLAYISNNSIITLSTIKESSEISGNSLITKCCVIGNIILIDVIISGLTLGSNEKKVIIGSEKNIFKVLDESTES